MIKDITDEELDSINYAISSRYGLDFGEYEKSSLKRRVVRVIHRYNLENVLGLWQKLLYDKDFINHFKDEVSVGLTEMFRNPEMWVHLKRNVLPKLADNSIINIWHAGCSTGEEVCTMAIVLNETGLLHKSRVLATDLSDRFVQQAAKATYNTDDFVKYEENYHAYHPAGNIRSYFYEQKNEYFSFYPSYLKNVSYKTHNLVNESNVFDIKFDIIFCRNVMIYFNDSLKIKVLKSFHQQLNHNGILIIGYFDAMPEGFKEYFDYEESSVKLFKRI